VGLDKIKTLVNKMQVKTLVERTETVVDQCTHFDLRRKLVQIFIDTIRMKGNGKDANQLANKLK
jgi:glutamate racemase